MPPKNDDSLNSTHDNFKRYQEYLASSGKDKLKPSKGKPGDPKKIIGKLAVEGMELLEKEQVPITKVVPEIHSSKKELENALGAKSNNPYIKARVQVLKDLPEWRRNEVLKMETNGNIDNKHYAAFVDMVAILGDTFSDKKS